MWNKGRYCTHNATVIGDKENETDPLEHYHDLWVFIPLHVTLAQGRRTCVEIVPNIFCIDHPIETLSP